MTDFIEVEHEGVEGTARVPASALKHMKGWTPVESAEDELKGKALDAALRDAGLSLEGTADEKRARFAEHTDNTQES
jgi:hypothetical protein